MTDNQFVKTFSKMIFFLVILTIVLIILGTLIGSSIDNKLRAQTQEYTQQVIASRTIPTGQLNVGELQPDAESNQSANQLVAIDNVGKAVYDKACFVCHATGLTGAPLPGDIDNWNPRIRKGIETLYSNAINGYQGTVGIMPPKGGNLLLTDEEVKEAVNYLVNLVQ